MNFEGARPAIKNRVFQNKNFAPSGKYKIGLLNYIVVKEGEIIDLTMFWVGTCCKFFYHILKFTIAPSSNININIVDYCYSVLFNVKLR